MHTDYGTSERIAEIQAIVEKRLSRIPLISRPAAPSLYVKELDRTACRWGMSGKELRRLSDAAHVLNRRGRHEDGRSARRTGRTEQFATRVSADFDKRFRAVAKRDRLLLAQLLEKALDAYEKR